MPISNILIIVLRLFSIQWFVSGLMFLIEDLALRQGDKSLMVFASALLDLLLSVFAWILAPAIARFATRSYDAPVNISGLTLADLYSFAFVFLGLYFMLGNLADLLIWFTYTFRIAAASAYDPERSQSLYSLTRYVIRVGAGAACLFNGRSWAVKLAARHNRNP